MGISDVVLSIWNLRDRRMDGWPLMDNPLWTVILCLSYFYFTKVFGPRLMKNRSAFQLHEMMMIYNCFQVVLKINLLWELGQCGWFTGKFSYFCQPVDFSNDPSALRIMRAGYFFYLSKYVDMLDTVFFVLRKKTSQITFFHVIHHGIVPLLFYPLMRFVPGGNTVVAILFNLLEHIFMYAYYLVSAMGRARSGKILKWKKLITTIQISQFVIVSILCFRTILFVQCDYYPIIFTCWIAGSTLFFLCLFISFYRQTYNLSTANHRKVKVIRND